MATETTDTVKRGRNRTLGVKTWLGAGALTLGVGAALACATAVAQADTGGHQSASSASASKPDAGPKHAAGVASSKRASAPAKANKVPVSTAAAVAAPTASSKPAASSKTARANNALPPINTPFGPITVDISPILPDIQQPPPGDIGLVGSVSTPFGGAQFGLTGQATWALNLPDGPATMDIQITQGTLVVPRPVAFLISSTGSAVVGALSVSDSVHSFVTSLQSGNVVGAIGAFLQGAPKLTNAVLFGQRTVTIPIPLGTAGSAQLGIPFGGIFAPLKPVTLTTTELSGTVGVGADVTVAPIAVAFEGSQFGGVARALIGLL